MNHPGHTDRNRPCWAETANDNGATGGRFCAPRPSAIRPGTAFSRLRSAVQNVDESGASFCRGNDPVPGRCLPRAIRPRVPFLLLHGRANPERPVVSSYRLSSSAALYATGVPAVLGIFLDDLAKKRSDGPRKHSGMPKFASDMRGSICAVCSS